MKRKNLFLVVGLLLLASCKDGGDSSLIVSSNPTEKWTVTFSNNYGNLEEFLKVEVENNKNIEKPSQDPSRDGYDFTSWYKDEYCKIPFDFTSEVITADTILYAGWEEIKPESYTVTWNECEGADFIALSGTLPTSEVENTKISFKVQLEQGYEGTLTVKVNDAEVIATDGVYSFTLSKNSNVSVTGATLIPQAQNYTFKFTLPEWDPIAENPRLYYWGSESPSGDMFTAGCESNMTLLEGQTYYIEIASSVTLEGLIIIFDQDNQVKQSFDITTSLPTEAGVYNIVVNDWANWSQNDFGVWCFIAEIVKE